MLLWFNLYCHVLYLSPFYERPEQLFFSWKLSGHPEIFPSILRSDCLTAMSRRSFCTEQKHGGLEWKPTRKYRSLLTTVWEGFLKYAGLSPLTTESYGNVQTRSQQIKKFLIAAGNESTIRCVSLPSTPKGRPSDGIPKGKERGEVLETPGVATLRLTWKGWENMGTTKEIGPAQSRLKEPCWRPMLQERQIGKTLKKHYSQSF